MVEVDAPVPLVKRSYYGSLDPNYTGLPCLIEEGTEVREDAQRPTSWSDLGEVMDEVSDCAETVDVLKTTPHAFALTMTRRLLKELTIEASTRYSAACQLVVLL